jgi:glycosyltransferase involved in cell wall biosynthesis
MRFVSPPRGAGWAGGDEYINSINEMLKIAELQNVCEVIWFRDETILPNWLLTIRGVNQLDKIVRKIVYSRLGFNIPLPVSRLAKHSFFWIPDLQDLELPEMFTRAQIRQRKEQRESAIKNKYVIYFSSEHARKIFSKFHTSQNEYGLLRFSVFPSTLRDYSTSPLDCRYCHENGYFYFPNQWWKHKNHIMTLNAYHKYKSEGGKLHFVLSGSKDDYRWPSYYKSVEQIIELDNNCVHNLGFLERSSQLSVLFNARSVLQTSLYEGWSTTIEEGLVSGKILIVSNLPVFVEQCKYEDNVIFVNPMSIDSLVKGMFQVDSFKTTQRDSFWRWARFESDFKQLLEIAKSSLEN